MCKRWSIVCFVLKEKLSGNSKEKKRGRSSNEEDMEGTEGTGCLERRFARQYKKRNGRKLKVKSRRKMIISWNIFSFCSASLSSLPPSSSTSFAGEQGNQLNLNSHFCC